MFEPRPGDAQDLMGCEGTKEDETICWCYATLVDPSSNYRDEQICVLYVGSAYVVVCMPCVSRVHDVCVMYYMYHARHMHHVLNTPHV